MEEIDSKHIHRAPTYPGALKGRTSLQSTIYDFRFTGLHKGELTKVPLQYASCVCTIMDRVSGDKVLKADEDDESYELEEILSNMVDDLRAEDDAYRELVPQWLGDA